MLTRSRGGKVDTVNVRPVKWLTIRLEPTDRIRLNDPETRLVYEAMKHTEQKTIKTAIVCLGRESHCLRSGWSRLTLTDEPIQTPAALLDIIVDNSYDQLPDRHRLAAAYWNLVLSDLQYYLVVHVDVIIKFPIQLRIRLFHSALARMTNGGWCRISLAKLILCCYCNRVLVWACLVVTNFSAFLFLFFGWQALVICF